MRFYLTNGVWTNSAGKPLPVAAVQPTKETVIPRVITEEAYKGYCDLFGADCQSLESLNNRGGFAWSELATLLYERIKTLEKEIKASADKSP